MSRFTAVSCRVKQFLCQRQFLCTSPVSWASKTPGLGENTSDLGTQTQRIKEQHKKRPCTCSQLQAAGQKLGSGLGVQQRVRNTVRALGGTSLPLPPGCSWHEWESVQQCPCVPLAVLSPFWVQHLAGGWKTGLLPTADLQKKCARSIWRASGRKQNRKAPKATRFCVLLADSLSSVSSGCCGCLSIPSLQRQRQEEHEEAEGQS